jgi:hypothetical protein
MVYAVSGVLSVVARALFRSCATGAGQESLKRFVYHRPRGLESRGVTSVVRGSGGVYFLRDRRSRHS